MSDFKLNAEHLAKALEDLTALWEKTGGNIDDEVAGTAIAKLRVHAGLRKYTEAALTAAEKVEAILRWWQQQEPKPKTEAIQKKLAEITGPSDKDRGKPAEIRTEWPKSAPPPRKWIIPGWLPCGRVALVSGNGGLGKSRLTLQLAYAIAAGEPSAIPGDEGEGLNLRPGIEYGAGPQNTVVMASWEDEADELHRKLHRTGKAPPPKDRLHALNFAGKGPLWGPGKGGESTHIATEGGLRPAGQWLLDYARECDARLLVIDPTAAAYGSDENSRSHVRAFMSYFDFWGIENNCAVLMVGHPPKTAGAEYSGSTDWHNAARVVWSLARKPIAEKKRNGPKAPEAPQLHLLKTSYWKPGAKLWLRGFPFHEVTTPKRAADAWAKLPWADKGNQASEQSAGDDEEAPI